MAGSGDFLTINPQAAGALARRGSAILVEKITMQTAAIASTIAPGSMKTKIRPIFKGSKANPLGIVMVDHPAAIFVLGGTKPHPIVAKGGALKFKWKGAVVYFKHVNHPGTEANNFLLKAMLTAKRF